MFVEPGISFNTGPGAMGMALPISFYVNRSRIPTPGSGDATFPKVIFLGVPSSAGGRPAIPTITDWCGAGWRGKVKELSRRFASSISSRFPSGRIKS